MLKSMNALRFTSIGAVVCITFLVIVVVVRSSQYFATEGLNKDDIVFLNPSLSLFQSIPVISFAFTFHINVFPIWSEKKVCNEPHTSPLT